MASRGRASSPDTRTWFDRFAERNSALVAHAPFFAACVAMVILWVPTYPLAGSFDTWQLLINTPTTIVTFLLVALLQNSQRRSELAIQAKLDALADGLADLMEFFVDDQAADDKDNLARDIEDLKRAVGLERSQSA